eukprot:15462870-Alexandrium_andersonii.AAC.1
MGYQGRPARRRSRRRAKPDFGRVRVRGVRSRAACSSRCARGKEGRRASRALFRSYLPRTSSCGWLEGSER